MIYGAGRLWLKVQRDRSHSPSLKEILSGAFCCACMESACSCKFRQLCIEVPDLPSHWEVKSSHPGLTVKTWGLNFWPPTVESAGVYRGRGTAQTGSSLTGRTGWQCNSFMEGSHYAAGSSEHVNLKYMELLRVRLIFYACILQLFGGLEDYMNSYPIWSTSTQYRCFHPKPTSFCQSVLRCACSSLDWSLPQRAVFLSKLGGGNEMPTSRFNLIKKTVYMCMIYCLPKVFKWMLLLH